MKREGHRFGADTAGGDRALDRNVVAVPDTQLLPARRVEGVGTPTTKQAQDVVEDGQPTTGISSERIAAGGIGARSRHTCLRSGGTAATPAKAIP